jgi:hypothetical protein
MSSRRAIVSSVIVVFQGSGYGLSNPTLTKFIAMAAIIQAAASYTTSGDTIHQAVGVEVELPVEPGLTSDQDVRALLFGCVRSLFLRV